MRVFNSIKNRRGGEEFLSPWNLFVLVVIAVGIVTGVLVFTSSYEESIKRAEASILSQRVFLCIVNQGDINSDFFKGDFNIFESCLLNEEIINSRYYLSINFTSLTDNNFIKFSEFGISDLFIQGQLNEGEKKQKYFAECYTQENYVLYSVDSEKNGALLKIISCSNNEGVAGA